MLYLQMQACTRMRAHTHTHTHTDRVFCFAHKTTPATRKRQIRTSPHLHGHKERNPALLYEMLHDL